jgi:hypothetical protein
MELYDAGATVPTTADQRVVIRYRFVPQPRSDVLTFVGQGRPASPAGLGNIAVSVPRIAVYRGPN